MIAVILRRADQWSAGGVYLRADHSEHDPVLIVAVLVALGLKFIGKMINGFPDFRQISGGADRHQSGGCGG